MSAPTDQFTEVAQRSQDAFTTATRTWVEFLRSISGNVAPGDVSAPTVLPYVDGLFDVAEKFLSHQREIAHHWVDAAVRTTEAVTEQAVRATKSVATHTANGAGAAVDNGAEALRATSRTVKR